VSAASFDAVAARRGAEARAAVIEPLRTLEDRTAAFAGLQPIGNGWTRRLYDGDFQLFPLRDDRPATSLVFVQSRDGNTVADDPGDLGGGSTDKHLIYEGLTRVAADAVLAGASTAVSRTAFFSVWHPQMVALREALGLPRHPVQIVLSGSGTFDVDRALLCSVPDVPAVVLAGEAARARLEDRVRARPWVAIVGLGDGLAAAMRRLRTEHHIRRVSAIGGRTAATALLEAGLVDDVHLTTTGRTAGEPGTAFYAGPRAIPLETVVRKEGRGSDGPIVYEQLALTGSSSRSGPTPRP
jgi:riboflavin biosynthesis pyrimidine reductase